MKNKDDLIVFFDKSRTIRYGIVDITLDNESLLIETRNIKIDYILKIETEDKI